MAEPGLPIEYEVLRRVNEAYALAKKVSTSLDKGEKLDKKMLNELLRAVCDARELYVKLCVESETRTSLYACNTAVKSFQELDALLASKLYKLLASNFARPIIDAGDWDTLSEFYRCFTTLPKTLASITDELIPSVEQEPGELLKRAELLERLADAIEQSGYEVIEWARESIQSLIDELRKRAEEDKNTAIQEAKSKVQSALDTIQSLEEDLESLSSQVQDALSKLGSLCPGEQ